MSLRGSNDGYVHYVLVLRQQPRTLGWPTLGDVDRLTFEGLSPEDRLLVIVGRTARTSVEIEHMLRVAWVELIGGDATVDVAPKGIRDLCRNVVSLSGASQAITDEERTALQNAVRNATEAHERRNTVVHERWTLDLESESWIPQTKRSRRRANSAPAPAWREADFESVLLDLNRALLRLMALYAVVVASNRNFPAGFTMTSDESKAFRAAMMTLAESAERTNDLEELEGLRNRIARAPRSSATGRSTENDR